MIISSQKDQDFFEILGDQEGLDITLQKNEIEDGLLTYKLHIKANRPINMPRITLQCKFSAQNIKGVWHPNSLYDKRLRADWESPSLKACVSVGAPVISLFGHNNENRLLIACSDDVHPIELKVPVREEDNLIYGALTFFAEGTPKMDTYTATIRVDMRSIPYAVAIQATADWWYQSNSTDLYVPASAAEPVYSTWYSYHQNLSEERLLIECKIAKEMGYKVLIIDDGWQTLDSNRGYDYTGDWNPERLTNIKSLVRKVQEMDMKVMLWFSVPFCGKHSSAYQKFKGKFLTENHRWAPVFDPRYPDVRAHLTSLYVRAIKDWGLDGLKLDFIDDFKIYPDTDLGSCAERDHDSIYEAVKSLIEEVYEKLKAINPDVLIEFRQQFIGPSMQQNANMFRAFDCPNDPVTNRIRISDTRLLCKQAKVHSDMITWHSEEEVEQSALQMIGLLFSVPQLSVRMDEISEDHSKMIRFYTDFWLSRRKVLLEGEFSPMDPIANYPIISGLHDQHQVIAVYQSRVVFIEHNTWKLDLVNGSSQAQLYCEFEVELGTSRLTTYDCMGNKLNTEEKDLKKGLYRFEVPVSGLIMIERIP